MALLLIITGLVHAATLDEAYVWRLNHTSVRELAQVRDEYEKIQVARLSCRLQLKEHAVPIGCYQALAFEEKWRLRPKTQTRRLRAEFDSRCARAAAALKTPPMNADLSGIPAVCRRHVEDARRIQVYRASSWPAN